MREALAVCGAGETILAAVSGGADSVCLLVLLCELAGECGFSVEAVHVNHGLRGEAADADEAFVRELCEKLAVPLTVVRADVAEMAARERLSLEEAGRETRYRIFYETAVEQRIKWIATAHHMDDNAETVLYRLARGTGLRGLTGIPPVRELGEGVNVLRPLLSCSREEIRAELLRRDKPWREDRSNKDPRFARNVIRGEVLLVLKAQVNDRAAEHIAQTAESLREVQAYLEAEAEKYCDTHLQRDENGLSVSAREIGALPAALGKEILRKMIEETCGGTRDLGAVHLNAVYALLTQETGKCVSLPCGAEAARSYDRILIHRAEREQTEPVEIPVPGRVILPDGRILTAERKSLKTGETFPKSSCEIWLDYGKIKGAIFLRTAQEEDYLVLDSSGHRKGLNRWFIDRKIPREKRSRMPLLACGSHVLWIVGERMSADAGIAESTEDVLVVKVF